MKNLLLSLCFSCLLFSGLAQQDTTAIDFVAYWRIGDSYEYTHTIINEDIKENGQSISDTNMYIFTLSVLDSTEKSYTLKLTFTKPHEGASGELTFFEFSKPDLIYQTDQNGKFVKLLNYTDLLITYDSLFSIVQKTVNPDGKTFQYELNKIKSAFTSEDGLIQKFYQEMHFLHATLGYRYDASKSISYDDELPNLLGSENFKATTKLFIENLDTNNYYCELVKVKELDQDSANKILMESIQSLNQIGLNESQVKLVQFKLSDTCRTGMFYDLGLPLFVEFERFSSTQALLEKRQSRKYHLIQLNQE
jgi:hypothetical protein